MAGRREPSAAEWSAGTHRTNWGRLGNARPGKVRDKPCAYLPDISSNSTVGGLILALYSIQNRHFDW